jgi:hypothetical protein
MKTDILYSYDHNGILHADRYTVMTITVLYMQTDILYSYDHNGTLHADRYTVQL